MLRSNIEPSSADIVEQRGFHVPQEPLQRLGNEGQVVGLPQTSSGVLAPVGGLPLM